MKVERRENRGMSFVDGLTLVFITLKLIDKIDWSWIWVLSPIWITLSLALVVGVISVVFGDDKG